MYLYCIINTSESNEGWVFAFTVRNNRLCHFAENPRRLCAKLNTVCMCVCVCVLCVWCVLACVVCICAVSHTHTRRPTHTIRDEMAIIRWTSTSTLETSGLRGEDLLQLEEGKREVKLCSTGDYGVLCSVLVWFLKRSGWSLKHFSKQRENSVLKEERLGKRERDREESRVWIRSHSTGGNEASPPRRAFISA